MSLIDTHEAALEEWYRKLDASPDEPSITLSRRAVLARCVETVHPLSEAHFISRGMTAARLTVAVGLLDEGDLATARALLCEEVAHLLLCDETADVTESRH
jgi:hypothetical protein